MKKELAELEAIGSRAMAFVEDGRFDDAKRLVARLKSSFLVMESDAIHLLIEAMILLRRGKARAAKRKILEQSYLAWTRPDVLLLLTFTNAPRSMHCALYEVSLKSYGCGSDGLWFLVPGLISDFRVLADSEAEAIRFIDELCGFRGEAQRRVLTIERRDCPADEDWPHRGVIGVSPFRADDKEDLSAVLPAKEDFEV